jgi:hypothetical protein
MKRILIIPILLGIVALVCALPAQANSVDLMSCTTCGTSGGVDTFPAGSNYNQYYGTGIGLVYAVTWGLDGSSPNVFEAYSGTTVGNITYFSSTYSSINNFTGVFSNATWNSKTDVLTATFKGLEYLPGTGWVPFSGHLVDTLAFTGATYFNNYNGWTLTGQYTTATSARLTTVPEPGSLLLISTGLLSMGGIVRRKFCRV